MSIRLFASLRSLSALTISGLGSSVSRVLSSALIFGAAMLPAGVAQAGPLGPASDYNVFILGDDYESNTDAQGKVAVGGNATFSSYSVASSLPANTANALVVGQSVNYTNGTVNGQLHYGSSASLTGVNVTGGAPINDQPINFTAAANSLNALSSSLSGLAANGTVTSNYGLTLTGTDSNLDVFHLTTAQLAQANNFGLNIAVPNGATVVINVDGGSGSSLSLSNFQMSINGSTSESNSEINKVLFNFSNVSSFTSSSVTILGSILAPQTTMQLNNGHIDGTLIGASLGTSFSASTLEAHNYTFNGNLPSSVVPEPSSVVLFGIGAVGCVAVVRRRRQTV